jgi:hypothetical protein
MVSYFHFTPHVSAVAHADVSVTCTSLLCVCSKDSSSLCIFLSELEWKVVLWYEYIFEMLLTSCLLHWSRYSVIGNKCVTTKLMVLHRGRYYFPSILLNIRHIKQKLFI